MPGYHVPVLAAEEVVLAVAADAAGADAGVALAGVALAAVARPQEQRVRRQEQPRAVPAPRVARVAMPCSRSRLRPAARWCPSTRS
jgi:hypothetical protein